MIISIKVQTHAKHSRIVAFEDDCLKIQVSAVPEKGKANQALIKLLAKNKRVEISGTAELQFTAFLESLQVPQKNKT